MSQNYTVRYSNKAVDSILRIIDTKEDSTIIYNKLKTINPYISRLVIIESTSL